MASITFYLKSSQVDKKGLKPILIQITHNYKRVRISTGEKIKPSCWNKKKQRAFENKDLENEQEYIRINKFLDDTTAKFKKLVNDAKISDIELNETILKDSLFRGETFKKKLFYDVFDEFVESSKSTHANATILTYYTAKKFFQKFEKDVKYTITLGSLDLVFYDKFRDYSYLVKKVSNNYFAKNIQVLKTMLNWAKDRGYYSSEIHKKFKVSITEKEVIYLRIEELMRLYNCKFELKGLERTRDIFCFGCFTGFRISDIRSLKRENINLAEGVIIKKIKKTHRVENIPLSTYAIEILKKYEDEPMPLPYVCNSELNPNIKRICKDAKIDEPFTVTRYMGNNIKEITKPKWQYISSHAARKTFVTNSLILHMNIKTIKSITGHKMDRSF